jgi:hypothetical protein
MTDPAPDARDVALGLAAGGARAGMAVAHATLLPARLALRAPVLGDPLRRLAADLAHEGSLVRARGRVKIELAAGELLAAPELARVVERAAAQVVATADLDRVVGAVLDHEFTERVVERALASPGLERMVIRVLESRLVDDLTEQILHSDEMERVVEHIATSPQVVAAVTQQTQTLAGEVVDDVRRRTQTVDDVAERTIRGWLRRPRPSSS